MNQKHTQKPLISVIMPVYNAQKYLSQAIASILNQTYQNFELIIVDDASTDNSWNIIQQYKKQFKRKIMAIRMPKNINQGGDGAGNIAFSYADGDYIARMDADDIADLTRLEKQVTYMENHPDCTVLGSSAIVIDKRGKKIGTKKTPQTHSDIYKNYFTFHPMIHPTLMIRRSHLPYTDIIYKLDMPSNNDYLTFFNLITSGKQFANLEEPLLKYRIHGKNDSLSRVKKAYKNTMNIRMKMVREKGYRPSIKAWFTIAIQSLVVSLLPERVLFIMYLCMRGIYTPKQILKPYIAKIKNIFTQQKPALFIPATRSVA